MEPKWYHYASVSVLERANTVIFCCCYHVSHTLGDYIPFSLLQLGISSPGVKLAVSKEKTHPSAPPLHVCPSLNGLQPSSHSGPGYIREPWLLCHEDSGSDTVQLL